MFIFDVRNEQFMPGVHIFLAKNKRVHIFSILIFFCAHWNHIFIAILVKCNVCVGS